MQFNKELLTDLLKAFPGWGHSPEQFLEFVLVAVAIKTRQTRHGTADKAAVDTLASAFLNAFKVDLFPYRDFEDLYRKAIPLIEVSKSITRIQEKMLQDEAIGELYRDQHLAPNQETAMEGILATRVAQEIAAKLAPFLDSDED